MHTHFHAVIWIDHREAKIFHFNRDAATQATIKTDGPDRHIHHHANAMGSSHVQTSAVYLEEVAQAVADAGAILITGPGSAKLELMKHLEQHDPAVAKAVAAVHTVDHPSDGQLLSLARDYFKSADKASPQMPR